MLAKLVKIYVFGFKESKDPNCELKAMTSQSWACLNYTQDVEAVGSRGLQGNTSWKHGMLHIIGKVRIEGFQNVK